MLAMEEQKYTAMAPVKLLQDSSGDGEDSKKDLRQVGANEISTDRE
jgi:hypothetical protein